jgi:hypothetical protein
MLGTFSSNFLSSSTMLSPDVEQIIQEFFLLARQVRCLNGTRFGGHSSSLRYRALVHHNTLSYLPDIREVPAHNCRCNDDQKHNARDACTQDPTASLLFVLLCKPFVPTITRQYPSFALPFVDSRIDILRINTGLSTLLWSLLHIPWNIRHVDCCRESLPAGRP